ncbi:hypothetical protein [Roseibium sp.]|uniref:hypothetical protein n=1 Tax=Roseibium sp. TaxID=1936156 RepID=UPI003A974310
MKNARAIPVQTRRTLRIGFASAVLLVLCLTVHQARATTPVLNLAASGLKVELDSGIIDTKGERGLCLEKVATAGPYKLVAFRGPGEDKPTVLINRYEQDLNVDGDGIARIGGLRLTRDGSLFHVRTWKSGEKQTELVQDGMVRLTWPRGTSVQVVTMSKNAAIIVLKASGKPTRIMKYRRDETGVFDPAGKQIAALESCTLLSVRKTGDGLLMQTMCSHETRSDIKHLSLDDGTITTVLSGPGDEAFAPLPRSAANGLGLPVIRISGTPAALHFFHATSGLILSQTGEPRACGSDAEGAQSWNQSYRARALALMAAKNSRTRELFAGLALKSLELTLVSRNEKHWRTDKNNPSCGWASRIYSADAQTPISLMINQAMIANSLHQTCQLLDKACPKVVAEELALNDQCLARSFSPMFDEELGLFRIRDKLNFRFTGQVAPWNWQVSFAALLRRTEGRDAAENSRRARIILNTFLSEMDEKDGRYTWRYWPDAYFDEQGERGEERRHARREDTGHAAISLLALSDINITLDRSSISNTLDSILKAGFNTPRDIDGKGPAGERWFPAGGWATFASPLMAETYAGLVPGASSADTVFTYAQLFDPKAEFELNIDVLACTTTCAELARHTYTRAHEFIRNNPFFTIKTEQKVN